MCRHLSMLWVFPTPRRDSAGRRRDSVSTETFIYNSDDYNSSRCFNNECVMTSPLQTAQAGASPHLRTLRSAELARMAGLGARACSHRARISELAFRPGAVGSYRFRKLIGRKVAETSSYYAPTKQQHSEDFFLSTGSEDELDHGWLGWRQDLSNTITVGRLIGSGSFGTVRMGTYKCSGQHVAVKFMSKVRGKLSKSETLRKIRSEVEMLKHVQGCPGAIRLVDCFEDERGVQVVTEMCRGGDLKRYVEECGPLSEGALGLVAYEILKFLKACHERHIVYADVKPANFCLVNVKPFEDGGGLQQAASTSYLKAIDMGSSQIAPRSGRVQKRHGTLVYMAPEVFASDYGTKADMWSTGVTLYWLYSSFLPYWPRGDEPPMMRIDIMEVMAKSLQPDFRFSPWTEMSEEGRDFVARCLKVSEEERISAEEALQHPWILRAILLCQGSQCEIPISKDSCPVPSTFG